MSFLINPYMFGIVNQFWTNLSSTADKVITGFKSTFTNSLTVNWGDGTTTPLTSGVSVNKTLGATNAIELETNNAVVTLINCGTSSPKLGGTVDLSAFPNLQDFRCHSNDITAISDYSQKSTLTHLLFHDNLITGPILNLSALTNLQFFSCDRNQLTGSIPSLSGLVNLISFNSFLNPLSGSIPSLDGLTALKQFRCYNNGLTGSIPNLSQATNLELFFCYSNQLSSFAGGSVSNTLGHFVAANNPLNQSSIDAILSAFVVANRTTGLRALNIGGFGASAPSYTGGTTTTSAGTNFTRSGTLVTVTNNITPHGHVNGDIVTITGITPTVFQGTFAVTRITDNQFQYTTISSGAATGAGTATMRRTTNSSDGYASYQNLALVSRPGGPWTISINQP